MDNLSALYRSIHETPLPKHSEKETLLLGLINFKKEKYDVALHYLKIVAEEYENAAAEHAIGRIYEYVDSYRDYKEADFWYELAQRHGNQPAHADRECIRFKLHNYNWIPHFIINELDKHMD